MSGIGSTDLAIMQLLLTSQQVYNGTDSILIHGKLVKRLGELLPTLLFSCCVTSFILTDWITLKIALSEMTASGELSFKSPRIRPIMFLYVTAIVKNQVSLCLVTYNLRSVLVCLSLTEASRCYDLLVSS